MKTSEMVLALNEKPENQSAPQVADPFLLHEHSAVSSVLRGIALISLNTWGRINDFTTCSQFAEGCVSPK